MPAKPGSGSSSHRRSSAAQSSWLGARGAGCVRGGALGGWGGTGLDSMNFSVRILVLCTFLLISFFVAPSSITS